MPDRIRVLWLIKGLGPGGAERLLTTCAAVRDREAFEYRAAYLLPWKDRLVPELERLEVPVECLSVGDERDVRWAARLRSRLLDDPVDIVHAHSPYAAGIGRLVARSLPRACRPRLVSTEHNAWSRFAFATRALNAMTSPLDDAVIAVSTEVRDSIRGPAWARAEVVVHGVPLEHVRAASAGREQTRQELGVGPDEVLVATVANYVPKKDYPNLLEAARRVVERAPTVRFVAVGQGPREREVVELRRRLGLEDRVVLTGYRDDAVRVLAGADLFVLASRWEGLPVALMEALALGLPVVATAVGGVPEALEPGVEGELVPPGRPERLAAAISTLAADPVRRKEMGEAARTRGDEFDIRRAVRRIEAIYREVVRR
jgi:L-malate glycosyltransferase